MPSRAVLQPDVRFLSGSFSPFASLLWLSFLRIPALHPDVRLSRVVLSVHMLQLVIPSQQLDSTAQVCKGGVLELCNARGIFVALCTRVDVMLYSRMSTEVLSSVNWNLLLLFLFAKCALWASDEAGITFNQVESLLKVSILRQVVIFF